MADIPPWLAVMRGITGMTETPGEADNPKIMHMADAIARQYPEMKEYCGYYTGDDVAWCGLTMAYVMTTAGIRPVFGPTDTDKWMWALAWADWLAGTNLKTPRLGCVVVTEREGGGHVTLYEETDGGYYRCRGGNQSDMVNVTNIDIDSVVALVWPKAGGQIPAAERRELEKGDVGSDVASVQRTLLIPIDGDFGPITEAAVTAFQRASALKADGVVGETTWQALEELDLRMDQGEPGISHEMSEAIDHTVDTHKAVQAVSWQDRGKPPPGYYNGMAKTFALALTRHKHGDDAADIMAKKAGPDPDADALTYYAAEFNRQGMKNTEDGADTLRHLFVMMIGLGMRESSGNPWEGRDMTASNVESETCEAGLFQTSWNISNFAEEIEDLLAEYTVDPNGFQPTFDRQCAPTPDNLDTYGSGDGVLYQWLAKQSPAFAALVTGIGMRRGRKHWGPIERREVEIKTEVDDLLQDVQYLVEQEAVPKRRRKQKETP